MELAVRGKLVEQDPLDEPSSALLERIRSQSANSGKHKKLDPKGKSPYVSPEEGPFEIPSSWEWVRLKDVADYNGRPNMDPSEIGSDIWVLDLEDIEKDSSRILQRLTNATRQSRSTKSSFCKGDVLYGKLRPYLNKVVVADQNGVCTTEIVPIVPAQGLDSGFLRLLLKRPGFLEYVNQLTYGVKMPRLGTRDAEESLHPLPPTTEQRRIIARVDELMLLLDRLEAKRQEREIARTAARDSALADLREAPTSEDVETAWLRIQDRFEELFATPEDVGPLRETLLQLAVNGRLVQQEPADTSAVKTFNEIQECRRQWIKAGKLRAVKPSPPISETEANVSLPDGWARTRLGDVLMDIQPGWSPQCEGRPRLGDEWGVLKVSACSWGRFLPEENKALPLALEVPEDIEVRPGDWIISRANTTELVGRSVLAVDCPPHLLLSDKTLRLTPMPGFSSRWGNLVNHAPSSRAHYASNAGGTSASMRNISQDVIRSLVIVIPPVEEQQRIFERFEDLQDRLDRLVANLTTEYGLASAFAAAAVHNLEV